jgi:glyoxylase-like metal-dependent hydrolase (beta-lactamase superfamily II)
MISSRLVSLSTLICLSLPAVGLAQAPLDDSAVRLTAASGAVYMADIPNGEGGGNVAVSIGPDGVLLVDDMFAASVPKLQLAIRTVTDQPIRLVINTHFHGDHIQGNVVLGRTATLVAHENVLERVRRPDGSAPFPMVTFAEGMRVWFNGETVRVVHVPGAHTDSDAIVFFERAHVLHMGDTFFFGMFPAVYRDGGGDIRGLISSLERLSTEFPADTKVIPGHGQLATLRDLQDYVVMLKETVAAVEEGLRQHKSAEELAAVPAVRKYAALGDGGAQTLAQYVAMLMKLLQ